VNGLSEARRGKRRTCRLWVGSLPFGVGSGCWLAEIAHVKQWVILTFSCFYLSLSSDRVVESEDGVVYLVLTDGV
jgi:hypothetical protein